MKNSPHYWDKYVLDNNIFLNQFKFITLMTTIVDNTFTVSMLGLHMSPIHEAVLLFQATSPEQKQTTLYVQNPNCTQLCHEAGASRCTQSWDQLCNAACLAFSCPLLRQGYEGVCVQASECMIVVVGECVQEIKNSSAPQPAAGCLLEAGKGTSSPGWPTPPNALWETGRS